MGEYLSQNADEITFNLEDNILLMLLQGYIVFTLVLTFQAISVECLLVINQQWFKDQL